MALNDSFLEDEDTGEDADDEFQSELTPNIAQMSVETVPSDERFELFSHGSFCLIQSFSCLIAQILRYIL